MTVAVVMGSASDLPTVEPAVATLHEFGVPVNARVVSAHRTPEAMIEFGRTAADQGYSVIVRGRWRRAPAPGCSPPSPVCP